MPHLETLKSTRTSEPQELPLSLNEAKAFLRIDTDVTDDDALIMALQRAAVDHVEEWTRRALITQTWRLSRDRWPGGRSILDQDWEGVREGAFIENAAQSFEIPKPPLQAVSSFQVFATDDTASEVATTVYFVDTESQPGRITLRFGQTWPSTTLRPANGIQVTFTAGYGDTWNDVPDGIIQAVRLALAFFYEQRLTCDPKSVALPMAVQALLQPYRIMRV